MVYIRVKQIQHETFQDYKKASMLISTISCNWKCLIDLGLDASICQNCDIAKMETITIKDEDIVQMYLDNPHTSAVVIAGLEPILQFSEILNFISTFRARSNDDIVIYTGYNPIEVKNETRMLSVYENVIVKYGRYNPNLPPRYDDVLGITLVSNNQYAVKIS